MTWHSTDAVPLSNKEQPALEVCVERAEDALRAVAAGATRLEINTALALDGLTPSLATCSWLTSEVSVPVIAMLRPHADGFYYSPLEQKLLLEDGRRLLDTGVAGIAFGGLSQHGLIDRELLERVAQLCEDRELVFHRAFDQLHDLAAGLQILIECGVTRVLTSGGEPTAESGAGQLRKLRELAAGRIEILPAGGVTPDNARYILQTTGCNQLHGSFKLPNSELIRPDTSKIERVRSELNL